MKSVTFEYLFRMLTANCYISDISPNLSTLYSGGSRISHGGGMDLVGGGVDSQGGYVLKILYVKMKELGPLGGACAGRAPLDPPML